MLRHSARPAKAICILGMMVVMTILAQRGMAQTAATAKAAAVDFRVETDIFFKLSNKEPDKHTLTLFKEGVYYDFALDESEAVTMIDPYNSRIIMIKPKQKLKTTLKASEVQSYVEDLQRKISNGDLSKLLAAASQVVFDEAKGVLRVGDEALSYESTLQPARQESMAQQYADFADWSARLNTILPPHFPPFVRFELNKQIASRGMLPETVLRTTKHDNNTTVVKARLLVLASLSRDDEARIQTVGSMLPVCQEVSQTEFFANRAAMSNTTSPGALRKK